MALHIKPLEGPARGRLFLLQPGFTIGRSDGDLTVPRDGKMSSRHATIQPDTDGVLCLVDNNSKNGLRVGGALSPRIRLADGMRILIGTYQYEIVEMDAAVAAAQAPKSRYWNELLADFAGRHLPNITNSPRTLIPFHPAVVLDFIRGAQAETRWVLGYGPRKVGATSIDLPIFESGAPPVCFEIMPTAGGISFKTDHPDLVKLNGRSTTEEILRIADIIKIHDTEIEVDFVE